MDARRRRERASAHRVSAATAASTPARSFHSVNVMMQALSVSNKDTAVKIGGAEYAVCERSKVRKLLISIQESFLGGAVAQVCANDSLLENFDKTVGYLRALIVATDHVETSNVVRVQGERNNNKRVRFEDDKKKKKMAKKASGNDNDRFYKPSEWYALSEEKRAKIVALRKARKSETLSAAIDAPKESQVSSTQTS